MEGGRGDEELTIPADCGDASALYAEGVMSNLASELVSWYLSPCYNRYPWGVISESPNCWPSKGYCEETQRVSIYFSSMSHPPSSPSWRAILPNSSTNPQTEGAAANPPEYTAVTVIR